MIRIFFTIEIHRRDRNALWYYHQFQILIGTYGLRYFPVHTTGLVINIAFIENKSK